MSSNFFKQRDRICRGSAMWQQYPRRDWQSKLYYNWVHKRENAPRLAEDLETCLHPHLPWSARSIENREVFRNLLGLLPRPTLPSGNATFKMNYLTFSAFSDINFNQLQGESAMRWHCVFERAEPCSLWFGSAGGKPIIKSRETHRLSAKYWDTAIMRDWLWAASSLLSRSTRRGRSDGKKLSIPSTSRTPATRQGAPEHHKWTYWHVQTIVWSLPMPHLSKLHRPTTREERDTQDGGCKSTGLINKVPDLWKVPTPKGDSIYGPFTPEEQLYVVQSQRFVLFKRIFLSFLFQCSQHFFSIVFLL